MTLRMKDWDVMLATGAWATTVAFLNASIGVMLGVGSLILLWYRIMEKRDERRERLKKKEDE